MERAAARRTRRRFMGTRPLRLEFSSMETQYAERLAPGGQRAREACTG